ncbi:hypothetical protein [Methanobrevibacter sp.]|uniref:hypothetical protein n=1 Tax=Methanobrevibacter sp. TaxID=66852 RepID=UPI0025E94A54|nr:hypothetical protein [Methanobrevibacter sp.]MBQ6512232.1 hypothetical protein [Methanobrevibacter sp.]
MKALTLEIENEKLIIDGRVIGDEEKIISHLEKSLKYDECKPIFEELKTENTLLKEKLEHISIWDLSEAEQEKAGRALARALLGGA